MVTITATVSQSFCSVTVGGAQFSDKHSNFIVNLGDARAEDVKALIRLAKSRALQELSIELEEEVVAVELVLLPPAPVVTPLVDDVHDARNWAVENLTNIDPARVGVMAVLGGKAVDRRL